LLATQQITVHAVDRDCCHVGCWTPHVPSFGNGEFVRLQDCLEWRILMDGLENGVHRSERPGVEVFGGGVLVEGAPFAIDGRAGVDGPDFATGGGNVLAAVGAAFFDVF